MQSRIQKEETYCSRSRYSRSNLSFLELKLQICINPFAIQNPSRIQKWEPYGSKSSCSHLNTWTAHLYTKLCIIFDFIITICTWSERHTDWTIVMIVKMSARLCRSHSFLIYYHRDAVSVSWIALWLHWDFGLQKDCGIIDQWPLHCTYLIYIVTWCMVVQ